MKKYGKEEDMNYKVGVIAGDGIGPEVTAEATRVLDAVGAKPNVMSSANESSSFPNGPETLNNRANIPSKKSNVAPRMMYRIAAS